MAAYVSALKRLPWNGVVPLQGTAPTGVITMQHDEI